ncbi:A/G-specific DNA-adenine glycosylase [Rarobacter incanus]|uniref:Adenine DNA glycosylase n=1 Tax=Rarobacter incanus TaxID=153494 RepID=A0A542SQQ8_9MICO|nr:A/G-specific DNA-adenine glycosylase [Rarobacter incanus]
MCEWYAEHQRDLPWRDPACGSWGVLVSEVMLQQTPVVRVLPRWEKWMRLWPTPAATAAASTADILRVWDRLGYPRRALRLKDCATAIVQHFDGIVPSDEARLRSLPGIGEYTAAAVVAFAFHGRSVVLDTNVRRVLCRAFDAQALPVPHLTRAERERAAALVPAEPQRAALWAAASMELGALVCQKAPKCAECPIKSRCAWQAAGMPPDKLAHRRTAQAWHGTDRQVRGQIMAVLRASQHAEREELLAVVKAPHPQFERALASLLTDNLVVEFHGADNALAYRLPT